MEISQPRNAALAGAASAAAVPVPLSVPGGRPALAAARYAELNPKLVAAAHQFEASMMAELLKPLSSGDLFGGDEEGGAGSGAVSDLTSSADGSGGALMSFGSEALAKAISEKGGLGIAKRVLDHFEEAASVRDARGKEGIGIAHPATKKTRTNLTSITKVTENSADKLMEGERR